MLHRIACPICYSNGERMEFVGFVECQRCTDNPPHPGCDNCKGKGKSRVYKSQTCKSCKGQCYETLFECDECGEMGCTEKELAYQSWGLEMGNVNEPMAYTFVGPTAGICGPCRDRRDIGD